MRIPSKILIHNRWWRVEQRWAPRLEGEFVDGYADDKKKLIVLDQSLKGDERTQVFLHEVFHALFYELGIGRTKVHSDVEEILVENLSRWIVKNFTLRKKKPGE